MKTIHIGMWTPDNKFHTLPLDEKISIVEREFKNAHEIAFQHSKDKNSTFIFLCPEYTFVNQSEKGDKAYEKKDVLKFRKRFSQLAAAFPDSIIIPGTILTKKTIHAENDEAKKKKYIDRFFNTKSSGFKLNHLNIDEQNALLSTINSGGTLIQNTSYIFSAREKN